MHPYTVEASGVITRNGKTIKPLKHTAGYLRVCFCINNIKSYHYIHRLVAGKFIPNPNNLPQVNHIDGNKHNNDVSNLEWVTAKENMVHAVDTGLINKDNRIKRNPSARYLTMEQANEIRAKYI